VVIGTDRDRKTGSLRALLAHKDSARLSYAGAFIALSGDERARGRCLNVAEVPKKDIREKSR
jgi:hypothetical protein